MDETADDGATFGSNNESKSKIEAGAQEGRFIFEKIFDEANTGNSGDRTLKSIVETVDTGDDTETANGPHTHNEMTRRRRKRRKELSKTVVNPDENFYFYWLMTVTVCVLYNLWTLIVRQSFPELQKEVSAFWYAGDGFTDFIFVCDIVVQFRTGYLEQGLMVYDSKKLATHYLKSRAFLLDILSLLPLDFLQWKFGVNPILRFPRFLKIYRIYSYYYMVESRTVYPNLWRVVNLIHILLILAHWFGCFYYLLSEAENFQGDWVYPYRSGDYATLTRKYLGSLYWSTLTLTTIGDLPTPETNAESRGGSKGMTSTSDPHSIPRRGHKSRLLQFNSNYGYLFTIVSYLIGVFIFATIVGQVGNVITNRNANRLEFERLLDGAKTYMRHHKVPGGMKRRVLRWYDYSWSRGRIQGGGDINTALGLLPDKLKTELALHVNLSVLKKVTIFQECQPEFLHDLVLKMKAYIFTPGDLICRKGEVAREMFIIADGILDVISETGRVLTTMKAGDFFGEIGILNLDGLNKRTADVRSVGYSELFSLSREDVLTAMKDYPEAQEILQNLGRKRLMEAKNASKLHKVQAKQNKDYDSSGDSDNAGKRIVEKLRSDVKGLKNALRRSRRGTRTKIGLNESTELSGERTQGKKQSILRRMSHVQSSDEFEGSNEVVQSPIGAGLPLLQRLKCLKEKQEKEKEEKARLKQSTLSSDKEDGAEPGPTKKELSLPQKVKLTKEKEETKTTSNPTPINFASTVRTQQTGFSNYSSKLVNELTLQKNETQEKQKKQEETSSLVGKETAEGKKFPFIEKIRLGVKEKSHNLKSVQESSSFSDSNFNSETLNETSKKLPSASIVTGSSEAVKPVPKSSLINKYEVPRKKEAWKILKKSSISSPRLKLLERNPIKKVTSKGTYLSKSDTVLERQKTLEKEEEKRSRSISSPEDSSSSEIWRKTSEKNNDSNLTENSNGLEVKVPDCRDLCIKRNLPQENLWKNFKKLDGPVENYGFMKKYDSISDLSPEYSGLPFVKKLKILNERQKLAELEKELIVRSASLDVPSTQTGRRVNVLIRSQSEASTIEIKNHKHEEKLESNEESRLMISYRDHDISDASDTRMKLSEKQTSDEMTSPESNETMERRHLKSILKKLSAEEKANEENKMTSLDSRTNFNTELKKLMRALTIEGYVARHKKLTKSVTFDSDTLPNSPEFGGYSKAQISDDVKAKGSKKLDKTGMIHLEEEDDKIPREWGRIEMETIFPGFLKAFEEEMEKLEKGEIMEKDEIIVPYRQNPEFADQNFQISPFSTAQSREIFRENIFEFRKIISEDLAKLKSNHQIERANLEMEIKKRDEIIRQLQERLQEFERQGFSEKNSVNYQNEFQVEESIISSTNEAIANVDGEKDFSSPKVHPLARFQNYDSRWSSGSDSPSKSQQMEDEVFELKEKMYLPSKESNESLQKRFQKTLENTSEDECEVLDENNFKKLEEISRKRHEPDFRLRRNWSVDESPFQSTSRHDRHDRHWSAEPKIFDDREKTGNSLSLGKRMFDRMTDFHRTFTCTTQDKEFFALDVDDDSGSSDEAEQPENKDWEIQMLVEEMEKKERSRLEPDWNEEGGTPEENNFNGVETLEDVKKLQEEINTLKQMVRQSDLTKLSNLELDMLETIIEAKDNKISQMAKSNSLDEPDEETIRSRDAFCESEWDKTTQPRKKPTFRQKLSKTLSFDFHDIGSRKSGCQDQSKIKKHKNISCDCPEGPWPGSNLVKNCISTRKTLTETQNESQVRSSLPILISSSSRFEKNPEPKMKTSLPSLIAKNSNVLENLIPSGNSIEDAGRQSDSVFELSNAIYNPPTSSMAKSSQESHPSPNASGLNSFIRSVGQKMKQAMSSDVAGNVRNQVPTISRLCDQIPAEKNSKRDEDNFGGEKNEGRKEENNKET